MENSPLVFAKFARKIFDYDDNVRAIQRLEKDGTLMKISSFEKNKIEILTSCPDELREVVNHAKNAFDVSDCEVVVYCIGGLVDKKRVGRSLTHRLGMEVCKSSPNTVRIVNYCAARSKEQIDLMYKQTLRGYPWFFVRKERKY